MNLTSRFSKTVLSLAAIFITASEAFASVGTLQVTPPNSKVAVNGKSKSSGTEIKKGDLIKTGKAEARITFPEGVLIVFPNSLVRLYLDFENGMIATAIRGNFKFIPNGTLADDDTTIPLGNNAAVGSGNFQFPSIGNGAPATNRIPVRNAAGVIVGFVVVDQTGRPVAYTDPNGRTLASTPGDGKPLSGVFGPGATT